MTEKIDFTMRLAYGQLDTLAINTIRTLAMDAVQQASSGHPGTPMAMAPVAYALWQNVLRFDPEYPIWPNRDRFILSAGHASTLLYAMLHLTKTRAVNPEYETLGTPTVSLEDLKRFRQLDSKCPGHPEYRWTSGVETTTGPLGQGVATSVGMAIGERWMASYFNRPGFGMIDFDVYALAGDGCMMEGLSGEAASLAGHLGLSNLCWIYDNNHITIEGNTALAFTEDVATRFMGYHWNVIRVGDANDQDLLARAFKTFKETKDRPTLIIVDSHIAYGAPNKQDTSAAHGEPLGEDECKATKKNYGWPEDAKFLVPDGVYDHFGKGIGARGKKARDEWMARFEEYGSKFPDLAEQLRAMQKRELPKDWDKDIPVFPADAKGIASRDSSGKVENAIAKRVPWLMGGAADLAPSTKTRLTFEGAGDFQKETPQGRNMHFGVREHAMGAILNGLSLCKIRSFGSGFLIFSDYMRAPIRLSALMELPVTYIFTHDSIGVGEDGPTHQPIEQLACLRSIPGLVTLRPGDANEVAEAWRWVMEQKHTPSVLILSRQNLPTLDRKTYAAASGLRKGAYTLVDNGKPEVILIGTGSEVSLCVAAYELLAKENVKARVVSMPSWELFEAQSEEYKESVLPTALRARVTVEQASRFGWERYAGRTGAMVGMLGFGASAPLKDLQVKFGFTPEKVAQAAKDQIKEERMTDHMESIMPDYVDPTPDAGAPPCTMVVFGATGDLTKRKLVPSLMNLAKDGLLDANFAVIGVAIQPMTDDEFRKKVEADISELDPDVLNFDNWKWFKKRIYYISGDFADPKTYAALKAKLEDVDGKHQCKRNAFFYLATAPSFFGKVTTMLGEGGLTQENGFFRRVIIEKPFGHDLASARALNVELRKTLNENQIYRIDHYLGKETVQNIMVLRFANAMFEPIWNSNFIDSIQITVAETLGVEHRGGYYDTAGALRDMVPNHIMQLMSLITMEPPISFAADEIRDEQVKVLRAVKPIPQNEVNQVAVRGQYGAGGAKGQFLPAYRDEEQVSKTSTTNTFVALKLQLDNWRWAGVPIYLRTGKRLADRVTEIAIQFKKPPFLLFRRTRIDDLLPNQLVLNIQPNEGLALRFGAKVPGTLMNIGTVRMNFEYEDYFHKQRSTGYERLMFDCMLGDATLFQRADMVEAGWAIIEPVQEVWSKPGAKVPTYSAGSWGPAEATALMARDNREWNEISETKRMQTVAPPKA